MPSPLEALQTLLSGNGQSNAATNPSIALARLRDSRLGDMKHNLQMNPHGTGATPSDVSELESDISSDPYTGVAEQSRISGINRANDSAISAGFGGTSHISQGPNGYSASGGDQSPAARQAIAARQAKEAESRIPIDVANISGETQRGVADIQGRNQQEIERMREAQATSRAHDALAQTLGVLPNMSEGDVLNLQGGGSFRRGSPTFPTGPAGVSLEKLIQKRMDMEKPAEGMGTIQNFFKPGSGDYTNDDKLALERSLDAQFPTWRSRVGPGFKFATPGGTSQAAVPGGGRGVGPGNPVPPGAGAPPAAAPGGGQRMTKPLKSGGIAYSDDGGKTWYQD